MACSAQLVIVQRHTQLCGSRPRRHLFRDLNMISPTSSASCFKAAIQGPWNRVPRPQSFLSKLMLLSMDEKGNRQATVLILNKERTLQRTTDPLSPISTTCLLSWQRKNSLFPGSSVLCEQLLLCVENGFVFFLLNNEHAMLKRLHFDHLPFLWSLNSCFGNELFRP